MGGGGLHPYICLIVRKTWQLRQLSFLQAQCFLHHLLPDPPAPAPRPTWRMSRSPRATRRSPTTRLRVRLDLQRGFTGPSIRRRSWRQPGAACKAGGGGFRPGRIRCAFETSTSDKCPPPLPGLRQASWSPTPSRWCAVPPLHEPAGSKRCRCLAVFAAEPRAQPLSHARQA